MPQEPKKWPAEDNDAPEDSDTSKWSEDQKRREYYYDDAHGYEVYEPEEEKEDSDEELSEK